MLLFGYLLFIYLQCCQYFGSTTSVYLFSQPSDNYSFILIMTMMRMFSKMLTLSQAAHFATLPPKPKIIPPPPPKSPPLKPKPGELPLSVVAQQLNMKQQSLRKQLLNPKNNFVNAEQMRMLGIINGLTLIKKESDGQFEMVKKSPVVTIMGHVDHGKTTLIDYLRKSRIAEGEVGGITQKIGAFHIDCHGQKISFIDTPGHEAFSNMRRRGAMVTDLVVLIVASTEGVKNQTLEVINLINKDQIPTIVAISKIDLSNADVQMVENSLFQAGLKIEPRGGHIPVVHISAKTGQNVDLLSELILDETKQLRAIQSGLAEGVVLEAYQDAQGFNAMTLIVKQGTLKVGSILIIGDQFTKVKLMHDDMGRTLTQAKPGNAIQIIGIPNIPAAGDFIYEVSDEQRAKYITSRRKQKTQNELHQQMDKNTVKSAKLKLNRRTRRSMYGSATTNDWLEKYKEKEMQLVEKIEELNTLAATDSSDRLQELILQKEEELLNHKEYVFQFLVNIGENVNNFNVIMRFSDRGVEETIHQQLEPIIQKLKEKNSINVNIIKSDVGEVTRSDMEEASTCSAEIFTFGSEVNAEAAQVQNELEVPLKCHKLIHTFLKDFEESAFNRKKSSIKGEEKGRAVIAEIYTLKNKKGSEVPVIVPGVRVLTGKLNKSSKMYIFRNGTPISDALVAKSIKNFKKEMTEVKKGDECTITLDVNAQFEFVKGDEIVAFE